MSASSPRSMFLLSATNSVRAFQAGSFGAGGAPNILWNAVAVSNLKRAPALLVASQLRRQ